MIIEESEKLEITLNYEFKLYTNANKFVNKIIQISLEIWNYCISLHRRYHRQYKKHLNKFQLQKYITKLKDTKKYQLWNFVPSQAIQDITDRIQRGYDRFFDYKKNHKKYPKPVKIPKFKKLHEYKSITLKQAGWDINQNNHKFRIKNKWFGYFQSRIVEGNIKTVTIKKLYVGTFIYLSTKKTIEIPKKNISPAINLAGYDFGMGKFLWSSEGEKDDHEAPLFLKNKLVELDKAWAKIKLTNSKKAWNLWHKIHWKVRCQRENFQWQLAHELTDKYDWLCFENLDLQNMEPWFQKKILDYGLDLLLRKTKYLCKKKKKEFVERDKWFPSSKMCSACGCLNHDLKLSDQEWSCSCCGVDHDRNRNAAINIKTGGTSSVCHLKRIYVSSAV